MVFTSLILSILAQHSSAGPIDYAAYNYGEDLYLRDQLIKHGEMFDDVGNYIIGSKNVLLAERLKVNLLDIPDLEHGEELFTVTQHGHSHNNIDNDLSELGRRLWTAPDKSVELRAITKADLGVLARPLFMCHGAVRKIGHIPITPRPINNNVINAVTPNPTIQNWVAAVSQTNLENDVATMEAFGTRRHFTQGEVNCENWLVNRLNSYGLNTSTFDYDSGADVVIGELPGLTDPDKIVIIGGHYDSINYAGTNANAPGADDDASGTSAVLEIARILSQQEFDYTIRFCGWSGEELGLLGSEAYASSLAAAGAEVVGMVQLDMIAYRASNDSRSVGFVTNDTDPTLNSFSMDVFSAYVPSLQVEMGPLGGGTSDHRSFFQNGFPAIFPFEDIGQYSPHIHGYNDVTGISANDFVLAKLITQGALATVAELARPLSFTLSHTPLTDTQNENGPYTVSVDAVSNTAATITSADLYWKLDSDSSFQTVSMSTSNGTTYEGNIPGQAAPAIVEYYVVVSDSAGNTKWLPEGFGPGSDTYRFRVGQISTIYFDDFDGPNDNGWTHVQIATQDDWMRGTPNGAVEDPSGAYSGANVWGNDLAPSGYNGSYASNVNNKLISPVFDCSGKTGVTLSLARWLTVEENQYDQAEILVNGNVVWQNPATNLIDNSWVIMDIDISAYADNNPSVQVEFQLRSDSSVEFGGWNIDDFEIYTLGGNGGNTDTLTLAGDTLANRGQLVNYSASGMSPQAQYGLLVSYNNTGSTIFGQSFDIGTPYRIFRTGFADSSGSANISFNIPNSVSSGTVVYLEVGAITTNGTEDSNMLTLLIL
jgi:hypothetical protein